MTSGILAFSQNIRENHARHWPIEKLGVKVYGGLDTLLFAINAFVRVQTKKSNKFWLDS